MKPIKLIHIIIISLLLLVSCDSGIKSGNELSKADLHYIRELGLINNNERIILFASQGGNQKSGNFISEQRLASYWTENRKENNEINSAEYNEIDTLITKDLSNALTYASYIKVIKKDGSEFKIYVDDNPEKTNEFFDRATSEWLKRKK
ncbi:hypothetical protein [Winogradskyella ouciana]|uniref:Lipoprotein n=1 Tax=Winogradskyella ouciana TaxID=2608631 RepID=A0A7K1GEE6_9FLAO|nr:hypothetical protein [Winogradskyella ouciana]MTE27677.1 hypothetical protein [Winogradskyella ouciana]